MDIDLETALKPIPRELMETLTRSELMVLAEGCQDIIKQMAEFNLEHQSRVDTLKDQCLKLGEYFVNLKNKFFGKSSERKPRPKSQQKTQDSSEDNTPSKRGKVKKLPSERYPNAPLIEKDMTIEGDIPCKCCGQQMQDSGMTDLVEYVTVIPKQYCVVREYRHKYRCSSCHGDIQTTPGAPRISHGSYSDEMVIDVALSKFCDLVPVERYCSIAARQGMKNLPPTSLISLTHALAAFLGIIVLMIKEEIMKSRVIYADETPHRMLEGSDKESWYFWGFSTEKASYFECHDTRSGQVAIQLLAESQCQILVSDVYSGYAKATRIINESRDENNKIVNAYCHAHARRKFVEAQNNSYEDAQLFLEQYQEIYKSEKESKTSDPITRLKIRKNIDEKLETMKLQAEACMGEYSTQSAFYKAANYFVKNYDGLTVCTKNLDVDLDNNRQERLLRNPVIGRKTWLGTHSIQGGETTAKLFTIIETCKLNNINPREYIQDSVMIIHQGMKPVSPWEFKKFQGSPPAQMN